MFKFVKNLNGVPLIVPYRKLIIKEPSYVGLLVKFDGDTWEESTIEDLNFSFKSYHRNGDYVMHGSCVYFINEHVQICKMNL